MANKKYGRPPKYNWESIYKKYVAAKEENPDLTISGFCRTTGYPYSSTRKFLADRNRELENKGLKKGGKPKKVTGRNRHDWSAYKVEFLSGDFMSLSEFARHKGAICLTSMDFASYLD